MILDFFWFLGWLLRIYVAYCVLMGVVFYFLFRNVREEDYE